MKSLLSQTKKEFEKKLWQYDNRIDGDEKIAKDYWLNDFWGTWIETQLTKAYKQGKEAGRESVFREVDIIRVKSKYVSKWMGNSKKKTKRTEVIRYGNKKD